MSAPLTEDSFWWVCPCGSLDISENNIMDPDADESVRMDSYDEVINSIGVICKQSEKIRDDLLEGFKGSIEKEDLNGIYDWLIFPKYEPEEYKTLNKEDTLRDVYLLLQKFAVTIDHMITSEEQSFMKEIILPAKDNLKQTLCEILLNLKLQHIEIHPYPTYDIMSEKFKNEVKGTSRAVANTVIFHNLHVISQDIKKLIEFFKESELKGHSDNLN